MSVKLVQNAIMSLINGRGNSTKDQSKRFYGYFLNVMRKHYDNPEVDTAMVNITDHINLYINLDFFASKSETFRKELLEHEVKHIILDHCGHRAKRLTNFNHKVWNYACDAVINEPLTSLHNEGVTISKLQKEIPGLGSGECAEYYYHHLMEFIKKNPSKSPQLFGENGEGGTIGQLSDQHDGWGKNEKLDGECESGNSQQSDALKRQMIKSAIKNAADSCGPGGVPMEILRALQSLNAASVNWKQQTRQFLAQASKIDKEPTRRKLNRRTGILNPGKRKKPSTKIAVAVDESGSVNDTLHKQFFSEIDNAARLDDIEFVIIHADCVINRVYDYKPGMVIERTGCGGTKYMPAIDEAKKLNVDGMIYFGDGDIFGEVLTKPNFPFLWAMEDGRNAPADWGRVCHVKVKNEAS